MTCEPGPHPGGASERQGPWTWRSFRSLAEVQVLHSAGDGIVTVALANTLFFALPPGRGPGQGVGLYLALTMAPFAVLSPLVGPWLDRRPGTYRTAIALSAAGRGDGSRCGADQAEVSWSAETTAA